MLDTIIMQRDKAIIIAKSVIVADSQRNNYQINLDYYKDMN